MSSVPNPSIPQTNLALVFSNELANAPLKTIQAALAALQNQQTFPESITSSGLHDTGVAIIPVGDSEVTELFNKTLFSQESQNPLLLEELHSLGFENIKDFARVKLEQEMWNRTVCIVDRTDEWIQAYRISPVNEESPLIETPLETFTKISKLMKQRIGEVDTVEKAIEKGWLINDKEGSTEQQRALWRKEREDWPAKIETWKANCEQLLNKMSFNEEHLLFSKDREVRAKQYAYFAREIAKVLPVLHEQNKDYDFYDESVPYILRSCITAWEECIEQRGEEAGLKRNRSRDFFGQTAEALRNLREEILITHVLPAAIQSCNPGSSPEQIGMWASDVHYKKAMKQWANAEYHLGIPKEILGEEELMLAVLSRHFRTAADEIIEKKYTLPVIEECVMSIYNQMSKTDQKGLIDDILNSYQEDVRGREAPCINDLQPLKDLYTSLQETHSIEDFAEYTKALKDLHKRWVDAGFRPPFSAATPKEEAESLLKGSILRGAMLKKENLQEALKTKDCSEEERKELQDLIDIINDPENSEVRSNYVSSRKERVSQIISELPSEIAIRNKELLKEKILTPTGELTPFGHLLLLAENKVLAPVTQEENLPGQAILTWAKKRISENSLNAIVSRVSEDPDYYRTLPEEIKNSPPMQSLLQSNPGLQYGISKQKYDQYMAMSTEEKAKDFSDRKPLALELFKSDTEVVLAAVQNDGNALEYASDTLKNDKEVVLAAVKKHGGALEFASENLKNDRPFILQILEDPSVSSSSISDMFECIGQDLRNDKELGLAAGVSLVRKNPNYYLALPEEIKNSPPMQSLLQSNPGLQYGISKQEYDQYMAMSTDEKAAKFLSGVHLALELFKSDTEVVLAAVKKNGSALQDASEDFRNNNNFILKILEDQSVSSNNISIIFKFISLDLLNKEEVVLAAVKRNGSAFKNASEALRNNRNFILKILEDQSVSSDIIPDMFQFISLDLRNEEEVVLAAVTQNGYALEWASDTLQNDKQVVLAAVNQNGSALQYASKDLQNDKEVVLAAVNQNGSALQYASKDLQNDKEVVLAAVNQNVYAFPYASKDLQNDKEIVLAAVTQYGLALQLASRARQNDKEVVLAAVKQNGLALQYASRALQNDKEVVLAAVKQNGLALQYASRALQNDKEIVLAAVKQDPSALEFASKDLQNDDDFLASL